MKTYERILSLDGGGSWAILQAHALAQIFGVDTSGHEILNQFDLVAANSGGSLVAGCLIMNMSPQEIMEMFRDENRRKQIFHKNKIHFFTRYSTSEKLEGIRAMLDEAGRLHHLQIRGDTPLNCLAQDNNSPDLLITAFDYHRQRATFFRSNIYSAACNTYSTECPVTAPTLAEALHASSTAPVRYFDEPAQFKTSAFLGRKFWDGAVAGYNNPVMAAVIESLANQGDASKMKIISLGTANVFLPISSESEPIDEPLGKDPDASSDGFLDEVGVLASSILSDPPDAASYAAFCVMHPHQSDDIRLVRMNPLIQPIKNDNNEWVIPDGLSDSLNDIDGYDAFKRLVALEMDAIEQKDVVLIDRLASAWIDGKVLNQSIQSGDQSTGFNCRIGHRFFQDARQRAVVLLGL